MPQETPYQKFNLVDADGNLIGLGGGGSGGSGDASAFNQVAQRIVEEAIRDRLPSLYNLLAAETQLTAPGSTAARDSSLYNLISCFYTVAAINTNVVVRLEGSLDNTNWLNLDATGDRIIIANGVYGYQITGKFAQIRFTFVSETGGTAATINVQFALGN